MLNSDEWNYCLKKNQFWYGLWHYVTSTGEINDFKLAKHYSSTNIYVLLPVPLNTSTLNVQTIDTVSYMF